MNEKNILFYKLFNEFLDKVQDGEYIKFGLDGAKHFVFEEDVFKYLSPEFTKNQIKYRYTPFEYMIIPNNINIDGYEMSGLTIQNFNIEENKCLDIGFLLYEIKENKLHSKILSLSIIKERDEEIESMYEKLKNNFPEMKQKTQNKFLTLVCNILDYLNNPDIVYIEHTNSEKNIQRRIKQGKTPIPNYTYVTITGESKRYLDKLKENEHSGYNYRFVVRGHFRHLNSDRYKEQKTIWVQPYYKGKGILIEKNYLVTK